LERKRERRGDRESFWCREEEEEAKLSGMSSLPKGREDLKLEACSEEVCNIQTCLLKNDFALERYVMFVLASPKEKQFLKQNPEREEVLTAESRREKKFSQANPEERRSSLKQIQKREVPHSKFTREKFSQQI
jgi:hypothetical protein